MKRRYALTGLGLIAAIALVTTAVAGGGLGTRDKGPAATGAAKKKAKAKPGPAGPAGPAGPTGAQGATGATGPSNAEIERDGSISVPDSMGTMQEQTVQGGSPYLFWAKAHLTGPPGTALCEIRANGGATQDVVGTIPVPTTANGGVDVVLMGADNLPAGSQAIEFRCEDNNSGVGASEPRLLVQRAGALTIDEP